jgi:hypothetical protein
MHNKTSDYQYLGFDLSAWLNLIFFWLSVVGDWLKWSFGHWLHCIAQCSLIDETRHDTIRLVNILLIVVCWMQALIRFGF